MTLEAKSVRVIAMPHTALMHSLMLFRCCAYTSGPPSMG